MSKIKKLLLDNRFYFVICALFFLLLEIHVIPIENTDDIVFANQLKEMGLFSWCFQFYRNWSGRIILTLLDAILLNLPVILWKILNSCVFALMLTMIVRISHAKWLRYALILMILSIPQVTFSSSALWITGSMNYLWPTSFMMIILFYAQCIFSNREVSPRLVHGVFFSVIFACNMEQTALISLVMLILAGIYCRITKNKLEKHYFVILLLITLFSMLLFLAPGNYLRSFSELLQWKPDFDMLTLFDKCFYGLFASVNYLMNNFQRTMLIFACLLFLRKPVSLRSILPVLYFFMLRNVYHDFTQSYLVLQQYNPLYQNERFLWIPFFVAIFVLCMMVSNMMSLVKENHEKIWLFLLFFAGLCSSTILGFSPTLTGSGERIYFVMSVLTICAIIETLAKQKFDFLLSVLCAGLFFGPFSMNVSLFLRDFAYLFFF